MLGVRYPIMPLEKTLRFDCPMSSPQMIRMFGLLVFAIVGSFPWCSRSTNVACPLLLPCHHHPGLRFFFLFAVVEDGSRSAPSKPMFFSRRNRVMPTSGHGPTIGTLPVLQRTATAYHHDWFETTGFDPDGMVMEPSPPLLGESAYDGGTA